MAVVAGVTGGAENVGSTTAPPVLRYTGASSYKNTHGTGLSVDKPSVVYTSCATRLRIAYIMCARICVSEYVQHSSNTGKSKTGRRTEARDLGYADQGKYELWAQLSGAVYPSYVKVMSSSTL